ncbi:MAG: ABC transporter permease subunit [Deltaproteobacteria bacterium]|nr:ABC transporter permease subunit [Deltaproteobacteria bacterium]
MRIAVLVLVLCAACGDGARVRIGSKKFTESVILAEAGTALVREAGLEVEHRRELGGTTILWNALVAGDIDAYPEYTGTIAAELLADAHLDADDDVAMRKALADRGIVMSSPLGFSDTYALGMREDEAARLGITRISQLRAHPELAYALSHEFLERKEGWPTLRERYGLDATPAGMDHELAYRGLVAGSAQVTDLYSTDAEIAVGHLRVLVDDLHHFPDYRAVWLWRADLAPAAAAQLERFAGRISVAEMIRANARARIDGEPEAAVAADLVARVLGVRVAAVSASRADRILTHTGEHLGMVAISMLLATLVAIPLGILAARRRRTGAVILALVGVIQTVPSLALLVFMIPLLGIGWVPAVVALFLYSLLPIVRNTAQGLTGIAPSLRESAEALGLTAWARLWRIELPLATPAIIAGMKTAAVINVGTATLGALIGAGGYGQSIMAGIRLSDRATILEGAVPAAVLALAVQGVFSLAERWLVPRGLRPARGARARVPAVDGAA